MVSGVVNAGLRLTVNAVDARLGSCLGPLHRLVRSKIHGYKIKLLHACLPQHWPTQFAIPTALITASP